MLPLFAVSVFHNGAAASGFALAVFATGNAAVLQFSGRWADTYGRRPMILIGLVGTGLFVGLMGLADTIPTLLVVSAFAGAASGIINPAQTAAIGDVVGNKRSGGQVLSTFQMAGDFGQILGPIVVGGLADYFGFAKAFSVCAGVAAMGVVAWLCGRETLQERRAIVRRIPLRKKKRL